MNRRWINIIGNGTKKIWVFPRMDYRGDIVSEFAIFNEFCDKAQFYIMDLPEKMIQESKTWDLIADLAKEVIGLVGTDIPHPDYIIGLSMGGMIAQELLFYKEFESIPVLVISSNIWANVKLKAIFSSWLLVVKYFNVSAFDLVLSSWICVSSKLPIDNTEYFECVDEEEKKLATKKILLSLNSVARHDARQLRELNKLNVTLWRGEKSVLISQTEEDEFVKYVPSLKIIHAPECGMRILSENKKFVCDNLREFIQLGDEK